MAREHPYTEERTHGVDDSQAPGLEASGNLLVLLGYLANRLKAITGEAAWLADPDATIAALAARPIGLGQAEADTRYVNETDHTKALHDALLIDAATLDSLDSAAFLKVSDYVGGDGKIFVGKLPDTVVGAMDYQGTWDAATNTPDINTTPKSKGDYWKVSVAGSTSVGGITDWKVGDWAAWNGTSFDKIDNTDLVSSVFGRTGAIVAVAGDYTASQITNTPAGNIAAATVQAAINELDAEKAPITHVGAGGVTQHPLATSSTPGFSSRDFTAADRTKLDSIENGATADMTATEIRNATRMAQDAVNGSAGLASYDEGVSVMAVTSASTGWPSSANYDVFTKKPSSTRGKQVAELTSPAAGTIRRYERVWNNTGSAWEAWVETTDHGNLQGLGDDDHPQYLNNTRGDARYPQLTHASRHNPAGADPITGLDRSSFAANRGIWVRVPDAAGRTGLGAVREGQLVYQADNDTYYKSDSPDGTDAASATWTAMGGGAGLPSGGAAKQVLRKNSATDGDASFGWPYVSHFFDAERTGTDMDLGTAGQSTKIVFNTENTDVGGWYSPTTGLATIPVTGLYRLYASVKWSAPASGETGQISYSVDGGAPVLMNLVRFTGANEITSDFEIELPFTAGQTVEIRGQTSLGAINASFHPATRFQMRFLGALS